jgi:hypothetical protein
VASLEAQVAALTAQVAELTAREEIRELLCRYGFAADTGSAREWSQTYAPDGVYDGLETISGRASFAHAIDNPAGVHKRDIESKGSLHTSGPVMIRVRGDEAWAEGPPVLAVVQPLGPAPSRGPLGGNPPSQQARRAGPGRGGFHRLADRGLRFAPDRSTSPRPARIVGN